MKLPTRDELIMLGLAGVVLVGVTLVVFVRQGRQLDDLKGQIASRQAALETDAQQVAVVPTLIRQVQDMKNRYSDFDNKMPKRHELHAFLKQVSTSLSDAGLSNQSIEPGNPTREEHFNTLPIIMRFKGNFLALAGFLDDLQKTERLSRVQSIKIASDEKGELNILLQMNIYFTES
ncbi:MAG: hypothetical protein EHM48_08425 [Planctomycetaceae bacterium]|nr:MAG: hypothetical protein EHM48_08425 [Planctomycetaceae bacterium]